MDPQRHKETTRKSTRIFIWNTLGARAVQVNSLAFLSTQEAQREDWASRRGDSSGTGEGTASQDREQHMPVHGSLRSTLCPGVGKRAG